MAEKRIIEQNASTELYSDDWFIKDSALEGTTKISQSKLKELMLDGTLTLADLASASVWTTNTYYDRDSVVYHEGKLYRNLSGKRLHEANFSTDDWTEIDTDFVKMINDLEDSMAGAWADTQNYYEGDYAFYNGHYYRCISNATTGTWEPNKWYETTLSSEIRQYLWKFAQYMSISTESSLTPYSKGQLAIRSIDHVDHLLMAKEDYPQGVTSFDPDQWIDLSDDETEWVSGLSKELVGRIDETNSDLENLSDETIHINSDGEFYVYVNEE